LFAAVSTGPRSYTTIEVARRLGVSLQTVQRWVDAGRLKAWKTLGGHRRIDADSAEALFRSQQERLGAPAAAAAPDLPELVPQRLSVVVVDDDPSALDLLAWLVGQALPGAIVEVTDNGFKALALIARSAPQIVITDLQMPHMNGLEMIRHLLADTTMRPRTLIAVSALARAEIAELGELPEQVTFFTKPVDPERFIATLRARA
jgi:excisionase family DNA binding protein